MASHVGELPDQVRALATERELGQLVTVRIDRSALVRVTPSLFILAGLVGGLYLLYVLGIRGVGLAPFGVVLVLVLYIVFVLIHSIIVGRGRVYLFEHGLVTVRRWHAIAVAWSEVSGVKVEPGGNLLGPVNQVLRPIGLRTGSHLGTMSEFTFNDRKAIPLMELEADADEPFRQLLVRRLQEAGTPITVKKR